MLKKILSVISAASLVVCSLSVPAFSEVKEAEEYRIFWQEDFDAGYSASDTAIKNFDTYETANTKYSDGTVVDPPSFWDGTYNYSTTATKTRDFNTKVVRKVEKGNGMMSFQRVGSGTTEEIYIEKNFPEALTLIPELIVEYKVRFTVMGGSYQSFNLRTATSADPARLQGPQFSKGYGRILKMNRDIDETKEGPTFTYGTVSKPSTKWYTVRVVHSNETNTRKTYIDGVYCGETDNSTTATYYKNGKYALRFECYCIATNSVIDIDDIKVMTKAELTSKSPAIIQNGITVSEYEYSKEPVSASTEIINYSDKPRKAMVSFAAYGIGENGNTKLMATDVKTVDVKPDSKETVTTDGLTLPSGVTEVKAMVWDGMNPLAPIGTAEKSVFTPSVTGMPRFTGLQEVGNVSFAKKVGSASTGYTADGLRTFIAMIGTPGYVYEFDTNTGDFLNSYQSGSGLQHCIKVGSDGKVYTSPTGKPSLWVYDPKTKENKVIKENICEGSSPWHMNYGADDDRSMLYLAVMGSNYATKGTPIIEYDIDNDKISVYEGFDVGCKYIHCATGDAEYVYTGSADSSNVATISRMNKKTGEIVTYEDDQGRTPGATTFIKVIGDYIFTRISPNIVVIDKNTMEKVAEFEGGRGQYDCVSDPDPDNPDIVYFSSNHGSNLKSYNMRTKTVAIDFATTDNYGNYVRYDFGRWFPDANGVMGISGVGGNPDIPGFFRFVPETDTMEHFLCGLEDQVMGVPTKPSYFYVSRDDILYTGGYEAGLNGFNLKTNTPIFSVENGNQHGMTMVGGMLFGGSYGESYIYMYNPSKKISYTNPKKVYSTTGVNRYYHTSDTNAGFGLSVGIADYGNTEGGVLLMTYYQSKAQVKSYLGVIPGENITGVAYKDGYIYASSSVNVPQHEFHEEAHVAKIDAKTGETVKMVTVNFEGLPKTTTIGEIRIGPDGLLYGKANVGETVFALNPDDLSLVKYKSYFPEETTSPSVLGTYSYFGAEGNFYTILSGDLYCINIENMEAVKLYGSTSYYCLDNEGNVLKRYGTNSLVRCIVDQRQRLEIMIKNAEKYYKSENYTKDTWADFSEALKKAKSVDIAEAYLPDVTEVARHLSFAIRDLVTVYDDKIGYAFPFK